MGVGSYGDPSVVRYEGDARVVRIGNFCSIAEGVVFIPGGNHRTDWVTTWPARAVLDLPGAYEDGHPASRGDIAVGNDVWIARGATVMSGVSIGDGAVVGGMSVVTRDVPPYAVVAGNPAEVRRYRFEPDVIEALLSIAWWNWPMEDIAERVDDLCSPDIGVFIEKFGGRSRS